LRFTFIHSLDAVERSALLRTSFCVRRRMIERKEEKKKERRKSEETEGVKRVVNFLQCGRCPRLQAHDPYPEAVN
jgi:hypothetical protein